MCTTAKQRMEKNRDYYNLPTDDFGNLFLFPAEALVLERFRSDWAKLDVLDLGVGVGRTAWIYSQLSKSYYAIDYAEERIDHCNRLFPEADHRTFSAGDARDLSRFEDASLDFVMFSYNGIDYIDEEGREKAFAEIHRVLKPGGWFFFSSHSLDVYPFRQKLPRRLGGILSPLGHLYKALVEARLRWRNRAVSVEEAREAGHACLVDFAAEMLTYYIDPGLQRDRLVKMGFEIDSVWDTKGRPFDFKNHPEEWMIQYLVRKP